MLNTTATRALLGAMILVCAPAMAIIPPSVEIRLGGAELIGHLEYVVLEGDVMSMSVTADRGSMIWAFAAPLSDAGKPDYSAVVTLLLDLTSGTGKVSGDFKIPAGLAGLRFQIEAVAMSAEGDLGWAKSLIVGVLKLEGESADGPAPDTDDSAKPRANDDLVQEPDNDTDPRAR